MTLEGIIITTAEVAAAMAIIAKLLFLGKRISDKPRKRKGWTILDNGEYVVFDEEESR